MRYVVDCTTGAKSVVPFTEAEEQAFAALQAINADARALAATKDVERDAEIALLRAAAKTDPTLARLLRVLGLT